MPVYPGARTSHSSTFIQATVNSGFVPKVNVCDVPFKPRDIALAFGKMHHPSKLVPGCVHSRKSIIEQGYPKPNSRPTCLPLRELVSLIFNRVFGSDSVLLVDWRNKQEIKMKRQAKVVVIILGVVVLWILLASISAGILGFAVILSLLALLDIVAGKFADNNKTVWLLVSMAALFVAIFGISISYIRLSDETGNVAIYTLSAAVSLILSIIYFLVGRRQKITKESE